ncbi:MAG: SDR family NAD(P)-dependent oxidoreductase [Kangiellaceae bacterium]|nr:SDR family NAD(P)-dependent oxidoreductase [Kangiellaceae bacterium]MCW9016875.1 SDR family NAD(P)-dependent oxidoreductase [Kangiellaceae bacterium]
MNYKEKVVWVTGASSGIGKQLCIELDRLGARLIMSSRSMESLEKVRQVLTRPDDHAVLAFDLCDTEISDQIAARAWDLNEKIDVLINNGGISQRGLACETSLEVDKKIMQVDYFGTIALTKSLMPRLVQRGQGRVVNISSIAGKLGVSMRSAYCGAKHALIGFMDCLRAEVAEYGVDIVNVCPGFVRTNLSYNALKGDMTEYAKLDSEIENGMPVERFVSTLLKKLEGNKKEIIIANGLPKFGYQIRRLFPNVYHWMVPKIYKRKD